MSLVAAFSGHRIDEPGRSQPRFPQTAVEKVAEEIRNIISDWNILFGFSSAAGGADLLFLEQLIARGGEPTIYLPFPTDSFVATSVGPEWKSRFEKVVSNPKCRIIVLHDKMPEKEDEQKQAYQECNEAIREAALAAARIYDQEPLLVAVLASSEAGSLTGGTAEAVRIWKERGCGQVIVTDPLNLQ